MDNENDIPLSYDMTTYAYTNGQTPNTEYFAKAFTTFNTLWKRQRLMYLGLDKNIFQARIFAIYRDPDEPCKEVVATFPGQNIEIGDKYFD